MRDELIIVGDSGHAKVCIELLRAMGHRIAYCVGVGDKHECLGIPVLRGDDHLSLLRAQGFDQAFVAIGVNSARRRLAALAISHGFRLVNAISPRASVSPSAQIGEGVAIMTGAVINADAVIGSLAIINTGACVDHDCQIGEAAHIGPTCGLAGNVNVGMGSFLGVGCKVIPEIKIGIDVVIGAGAVVIQDIPDGARAAGVPAKLFQGESK